MSNCLQLARTCGHSNVDKIIQQTQLRARNSNNTEEFYRK